MPSPLGVAAPATPPSCALVYTLPFCVACLVGGDVCACAKLPAGDVLLHCGDLVANYGTTSGDLLGDLQAFVQWLHDVRVFFVQTFYDLADMLFFNGCWL